MGGKELEGRGIETGEAEQALRKSIDRERAQERNRI